MPAELVCLGNRTESGQRSASGHRLLRLRHHDEAAGLADPVQDVRAVQGGARGHQHAVVQVVDLIITQHNEGASIRPVGIEGQHRAELAGPHVSAIEARGIYLALHVALAQGQEIDITLVREPEIPEGQNLVSVRQ